jgi:hypothetical protein
MFSTINSVKEYTGTDVTLDVIKRAQAIVEIYIGRDEIDVSDPADLMLLDKITSYQSAYMLNSEDIVFKQIASNTVGGGERSQSFNTDMDSPFIAPLAVFACKGLTWKRSKSFRTGKIFQRNRRTILDWNKY